MSGCASFKNYDVSKIKDVPAKQVDKANEEDIYPNDLPWDEAIRYVKTPEEARWYCRDLGRGRESANGEHMYGFKRILSSNDIPIDCTELTYAAAALLNDNGYPPLALVILDDSLFSPKGHMEFLYKQNGKFGTIGIHSLEPKYKSLDELAKELAGICRNGGPIIMTLKSDGKLHIRREREYNLTHYTVINLAENDPDFITADRDMLRDIDCPFVIKK